MAVRAAPVRKDVYDETTNGAFPMGDRFPHYENRPLRANDPRQRPWAQEYGEYGSATFPTSAEIPTSSFTFPESQARKLNPMLAAATYIFFKTSIIGVSRIMPMVMDDKQFHVINKKRVHASPMMRLPEESTPDTRHVTSEMVGARSERYGIGWASEANFDDTPDGQELRAVYLENFKICAELTIHAAAMVQMLSCQTLWHAFFNKECRGSHTSESLKRVIDLQKAAFGCVYKAKAFHNMLVTAFNVFPKSDTALAKPSVMIISRKALALLQQAVQQKYFSLDDTVKYFLQIKKHEHTAEMSIPMYENLELYEDYNEECDKGTPNPDYLFRNGLAVGQYAIFDIPYWTDPTKYTSATEDIRIVNYSKPGWETVHKTDAIMHGMPSDDDLPLNAARTEYEANHPLESQAIGDYLAREYNQLVASEANDQAQHFIRNLVWCAEVVVHKIKNSGNCATWGAEVRARAAANANGAGPEVHYDAHPAEKMNRFDALEEEGANDGNGLGYLIIGGGGGGAGPAIPCVPVVAAKYAAHAAAITKAQRMEAAWGGVIRTAWLRQTAALGVGGAAAAHVPIHIRQNQAQQGAFTFAAREEDEDAGRGDVGFAARAGSAGKKKKKARAGEMFAMQGTRKPLAAARLLPAAGAAGVGAGAVLIAALLDAAPHVPEWLWSRYLALSMRRTILVHAHSAGIPIPMQFYLMRPEVRFTATSYILAVPGAQTGYIWFVRSSFMEGSNAKNQTSAASFAMELGVMIQEKQNIMVLPDVELNHIESGYGTKIGDYKEFDPARDDILFFATGLGDMMDTHYAVPANGDYYSTAYMKELGVHENCTSQGYVSDMTQMLYALDVDAGGAMRANQRVLPADFNFAGNSVILQNMVQENQFMEYIEGTDDPENFHSKHAGTSNHMCFQMHQKMPNQAREIPGRSFLGEQENPRNMYTIFHGNFMREEEPIPITDVTAREAGIRS